MFIQRSISTALCVLSGKFVFNDCLVTRHSLVRAKGEVLVLLYVVLFVRFFVIDFSTIRGLIHAKVCTRAYSGSECVFSPFGV